MDYITQLEQLLLGNVLLHFAVYTTRKDYCCLTQTVCPSIHNSLVIVVIVPLGQVESTSFAGFFAKTKIDST